MTEDQSILRQAAAWIRGMADAGHEILNRVPNPRNPIPIDPEADSFVFLAGRPTGCNPNPRLVNCFAPSATAEGTVSVQDVGDVLARLSLAADAVYRGLGDEGVTPVAEEIRRIIGPLPH